jgi:hypothetical protein
MLKVVAGAPCVVRVFRVLQRQVSPNSLQQQVSLRGFGSKTGPKEQNLREAILRERNRRALGQSSPEATAVVNETVDDTRDFWMLALKIAPFAFVLGGFMEFFMINAKIGDVNFYDTVLRKAGERRYAWRRNRVNVKGERACVSE